MVTRLSLQPSVAFTSYSSFTGYSTITTATCTLHRLRLRHHSIPFLSPVTLPPPQISGPFTSYSSITTDVCTLYLLVLTIATSTLLQLLLCHFSLLYPSPVIPPLPQPSIPLTGYSSATTATCTLHRLLLRRHSLQYSSTVTPPPPQPSLHFTGYSSITKDFCTLHQLLLPHHTVQHPVTLGKSLNLPVPRSAWLVCPDA